MQFIDLRRGYNWTKNRRQSLIGGSMQADKFLLLVFLLGGWVLGVG
jgi:hypothetical protein